MVIQGSRYEGYIIALSAFLSNTVSLLIIHLLNNIKGAVAADWHVNGTLVGDWKIARGLHLATIYDASHMVGYDRPAVATDMINRFLGFNYTYSDLGPPSSLGDDVCGCICCNLSRSRRSNIIFFK